MIYPRIIQSKIEESLFRGKIIIIYGARRTGKTTLSKLLLEKYPQESIYLDCELLQNQQALSTTNSERLKDFLGNKKFVILDEAQEITNVGKTLKILIDTFPQIQILATGSSSFDLAQKVSEPLTGRTREYILYPLSLEEVTKQHNMIFTHAKLASILRFGSYPSVFNTSEAEAKEELRDIASKYLYKDILKFKKLKRPELLINLLQALALQVGNEVSYYELATLLKENHHTVRNYLELLEQCFVVFRLRSFSRNLRKEIGASMKVYFYDVGIRNTLINNFNPLHIRNDVGALWENFCVTERMKRNHNHRLFPNMYFWRTYDQKEIDYIEEEGGKLNAYEFKWSEDVKVKQPQEFLETYKNSAFTLVHKENYFNFLLK
ncbi:ATP-binding protein [Patescibacteria group bacterium]|nr:ATP-binding protein [Patescibacteria group bacterium]MBU4017310.1 ATP-binding protein [Patescibacteria group bacterium]MBU4099272.1 ATP-binding protein [Patescibacteria group bacterium]